MPLMQSKSPAAFKKNVSTEMKANPSNPKQNLAIAYSIQRKAKAPTRMAKGGPPCAACAMSAGGMCMAHGGSVISPVEPEDSTGRTALQTEGGDEAETTAKMFHDRGVDPAEAMAAPSRKPSFAERAEALKKRLMAHGGSVSPNESTDKNDSDEALDTQGAKDTMSESRAWQRMAEGGDVSPTSPDDALDSQERGTEGSRDAPAAENRARKSGVELARAYLDEEASRLYAEGGTVDPVNHDAYNKFMPKFNPDPDYEAVPPYANGPLGLKTSGMQGRQAKHVDNRLVTKYAGGGDVDSETATKHAPGILDSDVTKARTSLGLKSDSQSSSPSSQEMDTPSTPAASSMTDILNKVKSAKRPMYSEGGEVDNNQDSVVEQIMKERMGRTEAPEADESSEAAIVPSFDSAYHHVPDPVHGDIPEDDDFSVVGQILKARRDKRRGI